MGVLAEVLDVQRCLPVSPREPISTAAKLGLLTTLYLSQGLPFGFFTQALPVLLRQQGLSLPAIGLTSLLALPWALKFLWAPFVDSRWSARVGRRKSWILPLQAAAIGVVLVLAWANPEDSLTLLLVGVLLTNLIAATQDIATDGLAVSLLDSQERGLGNGVQVAGYRVGMIIGGGALLVVFDWLGWALTFQVMALVLALAAIPILLHQEASPPPEESADQRPAPQRPLRDFLSRPGVWPWLSLLLVFKAGDALAGGMIRPFLVDAGLEMADIGVLLGTVGFIAGLVGALVGGWGAGRLGRRRALVLFGVLQAVAVALYVPIALGLKGVTWIALVAGAEHFTGGLATAALFTAMMDFCQGDNGGTEYTVQASVVVIATGTAAALSGFFAQHLGYAGFFALSAVLSLAGVGALLWAPVRRHLIS